MLLTNIMNGKAKTPTNVATLEVTVGRFCRWPESFDRWLVKKAAQGGFRSPQEFLNQLIRQAKEADEHASRAA